VELSNLNIKNGLCISLGANIDSKFGSPLESLLICKPKIEDIINDGLHEAIDSLQIDLNKLNDLIQEKYFIN